MKTFEEFLEDKFVKIAEGMLDDDLPDAFDNWLGTLDGDEYMEYAQQYGEKCWIDGKEEILDAFKPNIEKIQEGLMKYTNPKPEYDGMMAGDLAEKIAGVDFKPAIDSLENITGSKLSDMLGK